MIQYIKDYNQKLSLLDVPFGKQNMASEVGSTQFAK